MDYVKKPANEFQASMQIKKENIAEAQKRKNDAIQIAGLQRDATILTAAMVSKFPDMGNGADFTTSKDGLKKAMEVEWEYWHNFLQAKLDKQILGF